MPTTVRSHSKINLGLAIGPPREDGFHGLLTLYQTLALHDLVTVSARILPASATHSRLSLTSDHARVPCDARNTAWKMIEGALDRMGLIAEANVHIQKRLPIQGGMGAGSANAAAALIALEHELSSRIKPLPQPQRLALAANVGSDVPLFLCGGAVLGTGRGEQVQPVTDLPPTSCVIGLPDLGVSTPRAFRDWDALQAEAHLTSPAKRDTLDELSRVYDSTFNVDYKTPAVDVLAALVRKGMENDFEQVVFSQHPSLRDIKQNLLGSQTEHPASYAALSGSGSALFGLYPSRQAAEKAQHRLQSSGIKAILTETLPREPYWGKMFAESPHGE